MSLRVAAFAQLFGMVVVVGVLVVVVEEGALRDRAGSATTTRPFAHCSDA